jgi:hypothetical protein
LTAVDWHGKKGPSLRDYLMKIFDFFSGVFLLFLSFGTCILAHRLGLGRIQHPGTGLIPFGTAVLLGVMSIGLIIQTLLKVKKTVREEKIFQETRWWTLVLVLCALVGYGAFFSFLGFNLSTFLLMVFFLVVMSHQRWWLTLAFSMGIVIGTHLIFVVWLKCEFPKGFLGI